MSKLTRRSFLQSTAALASAVLMSGKARAFDANGDVRVAIVGFKGRGKAHLAEIAKLKGVRIVALCDVDSDVLGAEAKKFADKGEKVETYKDIRKVLDNKDIDAISVATPNHWHALMGIWACQAGKDAYLEKPISHNVWEGRQLVAAARKYKRIVQTGSQSRSNPGMREAVEFLQNGGLGKIKVVRGLCYKRRASIGKVDGEQKVPASIDYDLWSGPAPLDPLKRKALHYDWHWVWPTGNGDLGNQGVHQVDIARWILKADALSPKVLSIGGRVGYVDDGTTPNSQIIYHGYEPAPLIFEVRGLPEKSGTEDMPAYKGAKIGVITECENGHVVMPSYDTAIAYDTKGAEIKRFGFATNKEGKQTVVGGNHFLNFINAVRSRNYSELNADCLDGHLSAGLCHTANISHRAGKECGPDEIKSALKDNAVMSETYARLEEHLGQNGIKLGENKLTLGALLEMDPKTERFTNHEKANELLTREYRAPFVVPKEV
jgi:predicted dehydrogenase